MNWQIRCWIRFVIYIHEMGSWDGDVYSDTEHVSGMVLSVMFQHVPRNMNSNVYKVLCSEYNKGRWISFWQYIYGVTPKWVYQIYPNFQD
jgi:hypothetical protein